MKSKQIKFRTVIGQHKTWGKGASNTSALSSDLNIIMERTSQAKTNKVQI